MKLVRFGEKGNEQPGILEENRVHPLRFYFPNIPDLTQEFWHQHWPEKIQSLQFTQKSFSLKEVRLGAPIAPGGKLLFVGKNYRAHIQEGNFTPPTEPLFFSKTQNALNGPTDPILLPQNCPEVDWEVELAVVIGKPIKRVTIGKAEEAIFGYTICNDVSGRTAQFEDGQWYRGKSFDSFAPTGPFLATPDEFSSCSEFTLTASVNNSLMQKGSSADMIFSIPELISYISQDITLEPGDLISTGTPEGVGYFREPKILLQENDIVTCTITGLGQLQNNVIKS